MFIISGHVQPYAWGVPGGLNPWLENPGEGPQAELWFGAHPNGPSPLVGGAGRSLADVTDAGEVPLLAKLMAADRPLSIQLHPRAELAQQMYAGDSPLLADALEKQELLLALEPFAVFAGWRDADEAAWLLRAVDPTMAGAAAAVAVGDQKTAMRALLALPPEEVERLAPAVLSAVQSLGDDEQLHSFALAARAFPGDSGLLVLLLLFHRLLAPGAAVYMPAGGVHAYVQGFGLEVMTSSDNVLRLGLTGKQVAVAEALSAIADDGDPHFLGGEVTSEHGHAAIADYAPAGAPFAVELVHRSATAGTGEYRLVLALRGAATVRSGAEKVRLARGQAAVVLAGEPDVEVIPDLTAVIVTTRGSAAGA